MEAIITLIITTTLLLGSPGPAPLALAGVGASFGFKQGVPFLMGILLGLFTAICLVAFGLGSIFEHYPSVKLTAQIIATAYLLHVAYKIATYKGTIDNQDTHTPKFSDGFILNLINPKVYAAFIAIFANFMVPLEQPIQGTIITGVVCFLVAVVVDILWLAAGNALKPILAKPTQALYLRYTFASLLVLSSILALTQV